MALQTHVRHGFTIVELLTTLAVLTIVMGLLVSLSRYARSASANEQTKDVLERSERLMDQYVAHHGGQIPAIPALLPRAGASESELVQRAQVNNQMALRALGPVSDLASGPLRDLPITLYDRVSLRDAWGSPIVFITAMEPAIGMSPKGWFFVSAGPDRRFLTRDDNLYSYEGLGFFPAGGTGPESPATRPAITGHRE